MTAQPGVVDVHSHIYPVSYLALLRERTEPPMVSGEPGEEQLILFPGTTGGPLTPGFWSTAEKLDFMQAQGISQSVVTLGNPWLDFVGPAQAVQLSQQLNDEMSSLEADTGGRLVGAGVLPSSSVSDALKVAGEIADTPTLHGIAGGCSIAGLELDDSRLDPIWRLLASTRTPLFVHPGYGVHISGSDPETVFRLALAFPFETTVALSRLVTSGVYRRFPDLLVIGSHGGGALPFLAARLDAAWRSPGASRHTNDVAPSLHLRRVLVDGLVYDSRGMVTCLDTYGPDNVMFGTDHPFPIADVQANLSAMAVACSDSVQARVYGLTAERVLNLPAI